MALSPAKYKSHVSSKISPDDTYGRYVFMVVSENPQDIIDIINEEIAKKDE